MQQFADGGRTGVALGLHCFPVCQCNPGVVVSAARNPVSEYMNAIQAGTTAISNYLFRNLILVNEMVKY